MVMKRLGDGSFLNTDTGELSGFDPAREAAGRRISAQMGHLPEQRRAAAMPPKHAIDKGSTQTPGVVVPNPAGGVKKLIRPDASLAVSPYEMGFGGLPQIPQMSETTKKVMLTVGIVAAAFGAAWINNRFKSKPAKHKSK